MALDPELGTELWSHALSVRPGRVLHVGDSVFVATNGGGAGQPSDLVVLDARTGAVRSDRTFGFAVTAAIARGDRVYFSGPNGLAALTSAGTLLFVHERELVKKSAWNGDEYDVVVKDGRGRELARRPERPNAYREGFLVLGETSSQPDFDT